MRVIRHQIKGEPIKINVAETPGDLPAFKSFVERNRSLLGWDTESTGLDWWASDFRIRLAQFGIADESYVIPVELGDVFENAVRWALWAVDRLVAHNGTFDILVVHKTLGVPMEPLAEKSWDTSLLAHLFDPRSEEDIRKYIKRCEKRAEKNPKVKVPNIDPKKYGRKLEQCVYRHISKEVATEVKGSMASIAKDIKTTKAKVWREVDTFHEVYNLYAGMDPIFTYRLLPVLWSLVPDRSKKSGLIEWEHTGSFVGSLYSEKGMRCDLDYVRGRIEELRLKKGKHEEGAKKYGVENVGSTKQLISAFTDLGVKLTKKTATGQYAMDDGVLSSIVHPLAGEVREAKQASKLSSTWFERTLNGVDENGFAHPSLNTLEARTSRMSISGSIPAQTFPKGPYVRSSYLADEGEVIVTIDYANMELRFAAADAQDPTMLQVFREDGDLHQMTADASGVTRDAGKTTNFQYLYGSGPANIAEIARISVATAKEIIAGFERTYPVLKKHSDSLQSVARKRGFIWTATGRRLFVDPDRPYSALNYRVQGSCRDVTMRAMIELHRHGMSKYVRLPIHDEFIFSFPADRWEELAAKAASIMEFTYRGLLIPAEIEFAGRSWGDLYKGKTKH